MRRAAAAALLAFAAFVPVGAFAQERFSDTTFSAEVVEVRLEGTRPVPGTGMTTSFQELSVRLVGGVRNGELAVVENTTPIVFTPGDYLYVHRLALPDGGELWSAGEPDRSPVLLALAVLFILSTVLVAGLAGVRSLVALLVSFAVIIFGLIPALLAGAPAALTSVGFAALMLVASMLITHGWNRPTLVALAGSAAALLIAAAVAEASVRLGKLSGFVSDEEVFLNFATGGALDLSGLLLGGILIGIVGVLNDISVSQAHTVAEIHAANPKLSRRELWQRAMKVGKEHLGAVVNTLPLAYAGAALPLLLVFANAEAPLSHIVNRELFSAEIVRILAGGIALSLSGGVATLLAVVLARRHETPEASSEYTGSIHHTHNHHL